jgi:uncharacterized small protein (DUF1192 family)
MQRRLEQIDESIARYLSQLDGADRQGEAVPKAKVTRVNEKMAKLRQEIQRLNALNAQMIHGASGSLATAAWRRGIIREELNTEAGSPAATTPGSGHLPIAQVPGFSQGAGTARVTAAASMKAGSSIPFATAEMRQR